MNNYIMLPANNRNREEVISMRMYEHAAGYGIYIMILEQMREAKDYRISSNPARVAFAINEPDVELVDRVINKYNLFELNEDGSMTSSWLIETMGAYEDKKKARAEAAATAAKARWNKQNQENKENSGDDANAMRTQCETMPNIYNNINNINKTNTYVSQQCAGNADSGIVWEVRSNVKLKMDIIDAICRDSGHGIEDGYKITTFDDDKIDHNINLCVDIANKLKLTQRQYCLLSLITDNGAIGEPNTKAIIKAFNAITAGDVTPKYVMNYLISKVPGYEQAKEEYKRRHA